MLKNFKLSMLFSFALFFLFTLNARAESINSLLHQAGDPVRGNPKGNISIVEFFDYQCTHCLHMAPVINEIIRKNPNVRVIYKEFPLRGASSEYASRAALAANKQGKYIEFSHALLKARKPITEEFVIYMAKSYGLNVNKLKKDMQGTQVSQVLKNNYKLAMDLNLTGTPAFLIGNTHAKSIREMKFVLGEMNQSQLQKEINNVGR